MMVPEEHRKKIYRNRQDHWLNISTIVLVPLAVCLMIVMPWMNQTGHQGDFVLLGSIFVGLMAITAFFVVGSYFEE